VFSPLAGGASAAVARTGRWEGVTVSLIVLMPAVAWRGLFGRHSTDSSATLDRIGRSVVNVTSNGYIRPSPFDSTGCLRIHVFKS